MRVGSKEINAKQKKKKRKRRRATGTCAVRFIYGQNIVFRSAGAGVRLFFRMRNVRIGTVD